MIDRTHALSLTKQADVLGISRGAVYDAPRLRSTADLALMGDMSISAQSPS